MTNKLADMTKPEVVPAPIAPAEPVAAPAEASAAPVYEPPASQPKPETSTQQQPAIQSPVAKPPSAAAAVETGPIPFVPASCFAGERNGFFFSSADQGLGYYRDLPLETRLANAVQPPPEKKPGCVDQIMSGCAVC